jgi:hypothetical protein
VRSWILLFERGCGALAWFATICKEICWYQHSCSSGTFLIFLLLEQYHNADFAHHQLQRTNSSCVVVIFIYYYSVLPVILELSTTPPREFWSLIDVFGLEDWGIFVVRRKRSVVVIVGIESSWCGLHQISQERQGWWETCFSSELRPWVLPCKSSLLRILFLEKVKKDTVLAV